MPESAVLPSPSYCVLTPFVLGSLSCAGGALGWPGHPGSQHTHYPVRERGGPCGLGQGSPGWPARRGRGRQEGRGSSAPRYAISRYAHGPPGPVAFSGRPRGLTSGSWCAGGTSRLSHPPRSCLGGRVGQGPPGAGYGRLPAGRSSTESSVLADVLRCTDRIAGAWLLSRVLALIWG